MRRIRHNRFGLNRQLPPVIPIHPLLVAVAQGGIDKAAISTDGTTWSEGNSDGTAENWFCLAFSQAQLLWVRGGPSGATDWSDNGGIDWTPGSDSSGRNTSSIAYSPSLDIWVGVKTSGSGMRAMSSPDGKNWTARNTPTSGGDRNWTSVVWADSLGLFVAVASTGTGNRVMTSPDGINWTLRASAADKAWSNVIWATDLGLLVAVATASGDGTQRIMTSPDGINWTLRTTPNVRYNQAAYSPSLGLFVVISAVSSSYMTSPDGINWTGHNFSLGGDVFQDITWHADLGLFVMVGAGTNQFVTSPDGSTWTPRTAPSSQVWFRVAAGRAD